MFSPLTNLVNLKSEFTDTGGKYLRARVACGMDGFLGKVCSSSPTFWILVGDKYHMELRGSPPKCAAPRAHRNVSLQMENVHSCWLGYFSFCVSLCNHCSFSLEGAGCHVTPLFYVFESSSISSPTY